MSRGGTTTAELEVITPLRIESFAFGGADTIIGAGRDKAQKSGAKLAARLNEHTAVALVDAAGKGLDAYHPVRSGFREVWIDGERVPDVTRHPAFKPIVDVRARIYDLAHESATRDVMSYRDDETGERCAIGARLPLTKAARAGALFAWFSPAFPTGGFAYSQGLETVVAEGYVRGERGLAGWLEDILQHGSGWSDAVLLSLAHRAVTTGVVQIANVITADAGISISGQPDQSERGREAGGRPAVLQGE